MIATLGNLALWAALLCGVALMVTPWLLRLIPQRQALFGTSLMLLGLLAVTLLTAMGLLMYGFVISDMNLWLVVTHSHHSKPLLYRLAGAWGNHEGSMLLLVTGVACVSVVMSWYGARHAQWLLIFNAIQGAWLASFIGYMLRACSPFKRLSVRPLEGLGLNPLLQDIGLAIHPPILYLGCVLLALPYALAMVACTQAERPAWLWRYMAIATRCSWVLLTGGIALGSWWAYRELGWGGFWFWDPVENISLLPWIAATTLMHYLAKPVPYYPRATILCALLTFPTVLLGNFLVRSGMLSSVHSFASDPSRGLYLGVMLAMALIASIVFYRRLPPLSAAVPEQEWLIHGQALLQACHFLTLLLALLYPLFYSQLGLGSLAVGEPYFVRVLVPQYALMLLLAATASHKQRRHSGLQRRHVIAFAVAGVSVVLQIVSQRYFTPEQWLLCPILLSLGTLLLWETLPALWQQLKLPPYMPTPMQLGHGGLGLLACALAVVTTWSSESEIYLKQHDKAMLAPFNFEYHHAEFTHASNYLVQRAVIGVRHHQRFLGYLKPEARLYPVERMTTSESDIMLALLTDIYLTIGSMDEEHGVVIRMVLRPGMVLVWCAVACMMAAGVLSAWNLSRKGAVI
jgi:cytochrome c-type biogenesis protein CcmF